MSFFKSFIISFVANLVFTYVTFVIFWTLGAQRPIVEIFQGIRVADIFAIVSGNVIGTPVLLAETLLASFYEGSPETLEFVFLSFYHVVPFLISGILSVFLSENKTEAFLSMFLIFLINGVFLFLVFLMDGDTLLTIIISEDFVRSGWDPSYSKWVIAFTGFATNAVFYPGIACLFTRNHSKALDPA